MNLRRRRQPGYFGFSLFELLVVIVIISVLVVIAISRLLALQVDAERVVMESVVGAIRSGLGIKVAQAIVKQNVNSLPEYENSNPMNLLAEVPVNYLGEFEAPDPYALEKGSWYFDRSRRMLYILWIIWPIFPEAWPIRRVLRFKIRLVYTDANGNGIYDSGIDPIEGLRLAVVEPYRWVKVTIIENTNL